jgi:hypothetical protein
MWLSGLLLRQSISFFLIFSRREKSAELARSMHEQEGTQRPSAWMSKC